MKHLLATLLQQAAVSILPIIDASALVNNTESTMYWRGPSGFVEDGADGYTVLAGGWGRD